MQSANVEVHGGATIEETVIPIIILSKMADDFNVEIVEKEILIDLNNKIEFTLFFSVNCKDIIIKIDGIERKTEIIDKHHLKVFLEDITNECEVTIDVYVKNEKKNTIFANIKRKKAAKINKMDF